MRPIIEISGLSKQYRLGTIGATTLRDALGRSWLRARGTQPGGERPPTGQFWALQDISLSVERGEKLAIVGRNGAGKSTLLKILSRITEPTRGRAVLRGRVASLLEIGTGFHPELSGRDNIFLNGAILGMRRAEIARNFDEIVAFAEVDRFLDTPVKRYSSGMYLRLAFAVAAHLQPDILLVDEVLAVGDAVFQKKCLGKMGDVAKEGRTVLFVSHNAAAVQTLCTRAVWLDGGRVQRDGHAQAVMAAYLRTGVDAGPDRIWTEMETAPGNDGFRLHRIRIVPGEDVAAREMTVHTPFSIEISFWNLKPASRLNLHLSLFNDDGVAVLLTISTKDVNWQGQPLPKGLLRSACRFPGNLLNAGSYRASLMVVRDSNIILYRHEDALSFDISDSLDGRGEWYGPWIGVVRPDLLWKTELVDAGTRDD